jgi:hypothetical protein
MSDGQQEDRTPFDPETVDGYLFALTAAYLHLVMLLAEKDVVKIKEVASRLNNIKPQLASMPAAQHWLDVTIKNFGGAE